MVPERLSFECLLRLTLGRDERHIRNVLRVTVDRREGNDDERPGRNRPGRSSLHQVAPVSGHAHHQERVEIGPRARRRVRH